MSRHKEVWVDVASWRRVIEGEDDDVEEAGEKAADLLFVDAKAAFLR